MGFALRLEFYITRKHNVSEIVSLPVFRWEEEDALLGLLERASLSHDWTMNKLQRPSDSEMINC
jgi:hypothetical protein